MSVDVDSGRVGRTPLLELDLGVEATVCGKAEWFNLASMPHGGGSVKTRIGLSMLRAAEAAGDLSPSRTIIEASSGNTGAAVARFGGAWGYDVEVVAPTSAGSGKIAAVRDAGGEIRFVDEAAGYGAFVEECRDLVDGQPDHYYNPDQYRNPANPGVHAGTTGPEIWRHPGSQAPGLSGRVRPLHLRAGGPGYDGHARHRDGPRVRAGPPPAARRPRRPLPRPGHLAGTRLTPTSCGPTSTGTIFLRGENPAVYRGGRNSRAALGCAPFYSYS